ncbi:bifunctional chorismate mutase/prephenate dehydrogenase [Idiomarina piscisalsi]|uniref:T-protein n=1 Tax=Idiomarina piscisalsi TaxID=1096243 RepID=A0ABN5ANG3_9GAMM|nr:bifunctional chorismate mutase/prephenate dehydrogenase [Idiomarina piscisalsi]ASG65428.1 bifunctional chorismate mutase/prephenate dehydrogenase [Idiomarina piscisalsi]
MNKTPQEKLDELRQSIDSTDEELIRLLAKREALTAEVGDVKKALRQPLYVPERENKMIQARKKRAIELGVSEDFVEDILRRVIRNSYQTQTGQASQTSSTPERPVIVVGGKGALGAKFVEFFQQTGYRTIIVDKGDAWPDDEALNHTQLVVISVPINQTETVIASLPKLPDDCVLADITSTKEGPLNAMLSVHAGPVVGLHPMFGPTIKTFAKQLIVVTPGRRPEEYQWLMEQLSNWGAHLYQTDAEAHDEAMGWVQAFRHLSTFVYGLHMAKENVDIENLLNVSSPIYRMELMMVGRLFAQNPELYADIMLSHGERTESISRYLNLFSELLKVLKEGNKDELIHLYSEAQTYFGDFSQQFLKESEALVQLADDQRFK